MKLTQEQELIVDTAIKGTSLRVQAYAGSGKTSLLVALAERFSVELPHKRLVYITFSKALADEASRKFPANTTCKTAHSLAFGAKGKYYAKRLATNNYQWYKYYASEVARLYNPINETDMSVQDMAQAALSAITSYCNSDNTALKNAVPPDTAQFGQISDVAHEIWALMQSQRERGPVTHDFYLKLWELDKPQLPYDVILFDEAQDASPVMLSVIKSHYEHGGQVIYVGDAYQQLYAWRGAVNAIQSIELPELPMSQSFRFGDGMASAVNPILAQIGAKYPIKGTDSITTQVHDGDMPEGEFPDAVLARTNLGVFTALIDGLTRSSKTLQVIGGAQVIIDEIQALIDLHNTGNTRHTKFNMFRSYNAMKVASMTQEGMEFRPYTRIMDTFGPERLQEYLNALRSRCNDKYGQITYGTVHRAKGMEFDTVLLSSDLKPWVTITSDGTKTVDYAEGCLDYVAMTRAKRNLYLGGFTTLYHLTIDGKANVDDKGMPIAG